MTERENMNSDRDTVSEANPYRRELTAWDILSSAWIIPMLLAIGWGPVFIIDAALAGRHSPHDKSTLAGFAMAWMIVALLTTLLAGVSVVLQIAKLLHRLFRRE